MSLRLAMDLCIIPSVCSISLQWIRKLRTNSKFSFKPKRKLDIPDCYPRALINTWFSQSAAPYIPQAPRIRSWVPPVTAALSMHRSTLHPISQASLPSIGKVEGDGSGSEHKTDAKTKPTTPVKASAENIAPSSHGSSHRE